MNPYLGPLQVSLSRMVIDIMKFTFLYLLVLFAFSCGMNQLLWYYADLEKQACMEDLKAHSNNQTSMHPVPGRKSNKVIAQILTRSSLSFILTVTLCQKLSLVLVIARYHPPPTQHMKSLEAE